MASVFVSNPARPNNIQQHCTVLNPTTSSSENQLSHPADHNNTLRKVFEYFTLLNPTVYSSPPNMLDADGFSRVRLYSRLTWLCMQCTYSLVSPSQTKTTPYRRSLYVHVDQTELLCIVLSIHQDAGQKPKTFVTVERNEFETQT